MDQFSSVAQSCPLLCDPMNCSMPDFPVHHQLQSLLKLMLLSYSCYITVGLKDDSLPRKVVYSFWKYRSQNIFPFIGGIFPYQEIYMCVCVCVCVCMYVYINGICIPLIYNCIGFPHGRVQCIFLQQGMKKKFPLSHLLFQNQDDLRNYFS